MPEIEQEKAIPQLNNGYRRITIFTAPKIWYRFKIIALQRGTTITDLINSLLTRFCEKEEARLLEEERRIIDAAKKRESENKQ